MPTFTLELSTLNAAFGDEPEQELSRILARVSDQILVGDAGIIQDFNGGTVGKWRFDRDGHFEALAE